MQNNNLEINEKNMTVWVDKMSDQGYGNFAEAVRKETRIITFKALKDKIKDVSESIIDEIGKSAETSACFVVPGDLNKSNTWIFLLFWGFIKEELPKDKTYHFFSASFFRCSILTVIKDLIKKNEKNKGNYSYINEKCPFFFFDDMAYSGAQIDSQFSEFKTFKNIYLALPYISRKALNVLTGSTPPRTQTLEGTEIIENLSISGTNIPPDIDLYNSENSATTSIVFQHKIADNVSVPQSVYAFGLYPFQRINDKPLTKEEFEKAVEAFQPAPLIGIKEYNSEEIKQIKKWLFLYYKKFTYKLESRLDSSNKSFFPQPTFYKNITYEYNGYELCQTIFEGMVRIHRDIEKEKK